MLDQDMKSQLKEVFANLSDSIQMQVDPCNHADQSQLMELLQDVASTSTQLSIVMSSKSSQIPSFQLFRNHQPTGILFKGIPSGHEFTSLILAILNASGQGKQPEEILKRRILSLRGPIRIQTYISLTCENCPDVVQALNLMATLRSDFQHEMIDGAYAQDEIQKLGIQGVPSLVVNEKMIHSGRINLIDLIAKLEEVFGKESQTLQYQPQDLGLYDVVVIGGGPAGVSSAIYSVRKGFKTAIIAEKIGGQVQETKGIENLISVVYTEGHQLANQLHEHLKSYPIDILEHRRVSKIDKDQKKITLDSQEFLTTKSLIVATGAKWRELGIPGEKEYLGRGVAFCPHCDGPFYKGKKVAVIGGGNSGVEAALDLAAIVKEVVLIEYADSLKADKVLVDKVKSSSNISVITSAKTSIIHGDGQKVQSLEYVDRKSETAKNIPLDGIFIQIGLVPNSQFLKGVVELTPFGEIIVDGKGRTSEKGIYAAGDVTTTPFKQIIIAMGEGAKTALTVFEDSMYAHS